MSPERWEMVASLFHTVTGLPPEERTERLLQACGDDRELRRELESLLANEDLANEAEFLESKAGGNGVAPGASIGPYTILRPLGAGGMGEVYAARDTRLERVVAVKFLPAAYAADAAALERFQLEAKAASSLNHPNICTIHDVGEHEGRPFLVMELMEGETLAERIDGRPLPIPEAVAIGRQVADALATAHDRNIIHRDIKPGNIFVTRRGEAKLLDFGLAKLTSEPRAIATAPGMAAGILDAPLSDLTPPGSPMGTVAYMSPEQAKGQAKGQAVDTRTDLFSLGVVLFEMTTGTRPFQGTTGSEVLEAIASARTPRPRQTNPGIPADLERVILKALEKNPDARHATAMEMCAGLAAVEREMASPAPYTRRTVLTAVGAGVAAVAGGAVLGRRALSSPPRIRVAVLPLANSAGDQAQAYFADGVYRQLISVLRRLYPDRVGVIAENSAKRYGAGATDFASAARELNVDYVVHGSAARSRDRAKVTVAVSRGRDGAQIWTETYDRPANEALGMQAEVAQALAHAIGRRLQPDAQVRLALERPINPDAHEAYLRKQYGKAIQYDPQYAPAHVGVAYAEYFAAMFGWKSPENAFPVMRESAERAVALDPTLADAHVALALSKLHTEWKWKEAEEEFRRGLRMDPLNPFPHHMFAHFLLWLNRGRESAEECSRAAEYDPFDPDLLACVGWHDIWAGNYRDAVEDTRRALQLDARHAWALLVMGQAYEQQGKYQEAIAALERGPDWSMRAASIAHAFALSGNRSGAESLLAGLIEKKRTQYVSPYDLALVALGLGDSERAFQWLDDAYREKSVFLVYINLDPRFKPLHGADRYAALLRNMGLTA